jgi:hypothetical protein
VIYILLASLYLLWWGALKSREEKQRQQRDRDGLRRLKENDHA